MQKGLTHTILKAVQTLIRLTVCRHESRETLPGVVRNAATLLHVL
jgi:hypothetical protein